MKLRTSFKNNKNMLIFLGILFLIGVIIGSIVFMKQPDITKAAISLELNEFPTIVEASNQNQIIFHILIILILFLLSFTVIGIFGSFFYLFYEGCSLGFSLAMFYYKFKLSGIVFSLIFNIISKLIFVLIIVYVCIIGVKIAKKIIGSIVLKQDEITYRFLKRHSLILSIVVGSVLLSEVFVYFLGNKILSIFLFLL